MSQGMKEAFAKSIERSNQDLTNVLKEMEIEIAVLKVQVNDLWQKNKALDELLAKHENKTSL